MGTDSAPENFAEVGQLNMLIPDLESPLIRNTAAHGRIRANFVARELVTKSVVLDS